MGVVPGRRTPSPRRRDRGRLARSAFLGTPEATAAPPDAEPIAVLATLKQRGDLHWVERAAPVRKHGETPAPVTAGAPITANSITAPTDPYYSRQWGLLQSGATVAWSRAATANAGTTTAVAVIDTGVQVSHPDLQSRLAPTSAWGRCDSGTCLAYVADNAATIPNDGDGHGTHVAGIVSAATDNAIGVAGVAGNRPVTIIPVKVLDDSGSGTTDAVAAGISWATAKGAKVINLSLGSSANTQAINSAIDAASAAGVLVVVSAGNCGGASWSLNGCSSMNSADYPAGYAGTVAGAGKVIPVAASTSAGGIASFSTQQSYVATAGLAAPGDNITSTYAGSSYAALSGTSMASPYVAGGAALVWSTYPSLTRAQLRDLLRSSATTNATTLASPNAFGSGLLNLDAALPAPPPVCRTDHRARAPGPRASCPLRRRGVAPTTGRAHRVRGHPARSAAVVPHRPPGRRPWSAGILPAPPPWCRTGSRAMVEPAPGLAPDTVADTPSPVAYHAPGAGKDARGPDPAPPCPRDVAPTPGRVTPGPRASRPLRRRGVAPATGSRPPLADWRDLAQDPAASRSRRAARHTSRAPSAFIAAMPRPTTRSGTAETHAIETSPAPMIATFAMASFRAERKAALVSDPW